MLSARRAALALGAALLPASLPAQQVTVTPPVAAPGEQILAVIENDTAAPLWFPPSCSLRWIRHSGEFVANAVSFLGIPPTIVPGQFCDTPRQILPGAGLVVPIQAPDAAGSYTLIFVFGNRAATRVDVVSPSAAPQDIAFYPGNIRWPQRAHELDFADPSFTPWEFANTGAVPHVFGAGDRVELYASGSPTPVASLDLNGVTVPAGGVTPVVLPVAGLVPGPYDLAAIYTDPGTGTLVAHRTGTQETGAGVDLHLLGDRKIAFGASLPMAVTLSNFPTGDGDPFYILLVGHAAGSTTLPGGVQWPMVLDGLAVGSLTGLGGLLTANIGLVANIYPPSSPVGFEGAASGIAFANPNIPALAGVALRVAVIGVDPTGTVWGASQAEQIIL